MKLFFLNTTDKPGVELWGKRQWCIAGIACPRCGLRSRFSTDYPVVNLSGFEPPIPGRPLTRGEFDALKVRLRPLIPAELAILPCTGLGPLIAEAKGKIGDAIRVVGGGTSCVSADKFDAIRANGLAGLEAVSVKLKYRQNPNFRVVEFQIQGHVFLGSPSFSGVNPDKCNICESIPNLRELTQKLVTVKRSSIPKIGDVFGLYEWHQGLIVTERFVDAASRVLRHAQFVEIPLTDE